MWTIWTGGLGIFVIILVGLITYIARWLKYWKRKNIPYVSFGLPERGTWPGMMFKRYYDWAKTSGHKHMGFFALWIPTYMPIDPAIIKNILGKDFNYFTDRGMYSNVQVDPIGAHLFVLEGQKWKDLRNKLTPIFTPGKIKMMLNSLVAIGDNLKNVVSESISSKRLVDMRTLMKCYTTDVIGSCAFGLDCNSFENPNSEFMINGQKIVNGANSLFLRSFIGFSCPKLANLIGLRTTEKSVADFFLRLSCETIDYRRTNNVTRNDLLQILINLKDDAKNANDDNSISGLTVEEIASQCFLFFVAGYETSSGTLTFCLYELAVNYEIQSRVRDEMNRVLKEHNDEITYEALAEMKYTGQVIDETLRKHPSLPVINRCSVADYKIPGTDIVLEKKTLCIIPVYALHRDPDHFPNPEKFDPERFNTGNKIDPYTYLPFGNGPRNCIGLRLGIMQVKIGLIMLLRNFSFSLNEKTIHPVQLDPNLFTASIRGGLWLNFSKLDN